MDHGLKSHGQYSHGLKRSLTHFGIRPAKYFCLNFGDFNLHVEELQLSEVCYCSSECS